MSDASSVNPDRPSAPGPASTPGPASPSSPGDQPPAASPVPAALPEGEPTTRQPLTTLRGIPVVSSAPAPGAADDAARRGPARNLPPPGAPLPMASIPSGPSGSSGPSGTSPARPAMIMAGDLTDPISHEMVMAVSRFLRPARALPDDAVQPLRGDVLLAYDNVVRGVDAVLPHEEHLRGALPLIDFRILRELPQLALATSFAASQVDRQARGQVTPLLARAVHLRKLLLTAAEMLVLSGDLVDQDLEKIRRGSGPLDTANDCIDLAALFRMHDGARRRTVLTDELLNEAQELGSHLLKLVSARSSRRRTTLPPSDPSVQLRDRLWTLLNLRHRELRRVGMWLFMDEVDAHVPRILARPTEPKLDAPPRSGP